MKKKIADQSVIDTYSLALARALVNLQLMIRLDMDKLNTYFSYPYRYFSYSSANLPGKPKLFGSPVVVLAYLL